LLGTRREVSQESDHDIAGNPALGEYLSQMRDCVGELWRVGCFVLYRRVGVITEFVKKIGDVFQRARLRARQFVNLSMQAV
jgi:hypothetical protein